MTSICFFFYDFNANVLLSTIILQLVNMSKNHDNLVMEKCKIRQICSTRGNQWLVNKTHPSIRVKKLLTCDTECHNI